MQEPSSVFGVATRQDSVSILCYWSVNIFLMISYDLITVMISLVILHCACFTVDAT